MEFKNIFEFLKLKKLFETKQDVNFSCKKLLPIKHFANYLTNFLSNQPTNKIFEQQNKYTLVQ